MSSNPKRVWHSCTYSTVTKWLLSMTYKVSQCSMKYYNANEWLVIMCIFNTHTQKCNAVQHSERDSKPRVSERTILFHLGSTKTQPLGSDEPLSGKREKHKSAAWIKRGDNGVNSAGLPNVCPARRNPSPRNNSCLDYDIRYRIVESDLNGPKGWLPPPF